MTPEQKLQCYVAARLRWLQALPEHPRKARLATLRRGVGYTPGGLPALWGVFLQDMPEELLSRTGDPTPAEWAAYLALTLYALHQQSQAAPMHKEGEGLGKAARRLVEPGKDPGESSIQKRFNALATAVQMPEISHHLRGMVQLLRTGGIPLDYVQLAVDLYDLQFADTVACVRLRWGQDFYRDPKEEEPGTNA